MGGLTLGFGNNNTPDCEAPQGSLSMSLGANRTCWPPCPHTHPLSDIIADSTFVGKVPQWTTSGWVAVPVSGGAITSINGLTAAAQFLVVGSAGTDFAINSSGATHTFNIPSASASNRGLLTSADWTTFNSKVSPSRLINTTAPLQGGGDLSADRTLSMTQAGAASNGWLSSTDWNSFNNKPSGSGTNTHVAFWTGASTLSGDSLFVWDTTNKRLVVGNPSVPAGRFDVRSAGNAAGTVASRVQANSAAAWTNEVLWQVNENGYTRALMPFESGTSSDFYEWFRTNGTSRFKFRHDTSATFEVWCADAAGYGTKYALRFEPSGIARAYNMYLQNDTGQLIWASSGANYLARLRASNQDTMTFNYGYSNANFTLLTSVAWNIFTQANSGSDSTGVTYERYEQHLLPFYLDGVAGQNPLFFRMTPASSYAPNMYHWLTNNYTAFGLPEITTVTNKQRAGTLVTLSVGSTASLTSGSTYLVITDDRRLDGIYALTVTGATTLTYNTAGSGTIASVAAAGRIIQVPTEIVDVYGRIRNRAGTSTDRLKVAGVLKDFYTTVTNTAGVETDLMAYTTKANTLSSDGDKLIFEAGGLFDASAQVDKRIRIYFGGTAVLDTGATGITTAASWRGITTIIRTSSSTVRVISEWNISDATFGANDNTVVTQTDIAGLTLSGTNIIKITGSSTGADVVGKLGFIQWSPAAEN